MKTKTLATGLITGGLAGVSHAATVQITLTGNFISSSGNMLLADVTGDGMGDVSFTSSVANSGYAGVTIDTGRVVAQRGLAGSMGVYVTTFQVDAAFALGVGTPDATSYAPNDIKFLNQITFTDANINGGAATNGYLEVNAFNTSPGSHTVALTRLVFDDASTVRPTGVSTATTYTEFVPEPSSLTLLALGAGGLMARRKREQAAA